MNIYAFKPHLSLWVASRLIICYWFPYRTAYISLLISRPYRSLCDSREPFLYFFFFLSFFFFLQALLSLCRSVGNMFFTVWLVTLYEGGILITGPTSSPKSAFIFSLTDWIKGRLGQIVWLDLDADKFEWNRTEKNSFNKDVSQTWPGSWYSKNTDLGVIWWKSLIVHPDSGLDFLTSSFIKRTTGTRCLTSETFGQPYWIVRPLRALPRPLSPWPISYHQNDKGMEMKERRKGAGGGGGRRGGLGEKEE